jgi:hypothetical protein
MRGVSVDAAKRERVLRLRGGGHSYSAIGVAVGLSHEWVRQIVLREQARVRRERRTR